MGLKQAKTSRDLTYKVFTKSNIDSVAAFTRYGYEIRLYRGQGLKSINIHFCNAYALEELSIDRIKNQQSDADNDYRNSR